MPHRPPVFRSLPGIPAGSSATSHRGFDGSRHSGAGTTGDRATRSHPPVSARGASLDDEPGLGAARLHNGNRLHWAQQGQPYALSGSKGGRQRRYEAVLGPQGLRFVRAQARQAGPRRHRARRPASRERAGRSSTRCLGRRRPPGRAEQRLRGVKRRHGNAASRAHGWRVSKAVPSAAVNMTMISRPGEAASKARHTLLNAPTARTAVAARTEVGRSARASRLIDSVSGLG